MGLGFILGIAGICLMASIAGYCYGRHDGMAEGQSSVMRCIYRVSDIYEQPDKKMSNRKRLNDKHMKLIKELSKLNALDTEELEDGREEISLYIYKKQEDLLFLKHNGRKKINFSEKNIVVK